MNGKEYYEMKRTLCMILVVILSIAALQGCAKSSGGFDASMEIGLSSRESGSGTRSAFVELFGIEQKDENGDKVDRTLESAVQTNSTAVMMNTVAGDPYAIGYISLGSLNDTVKALLIDGVAPSVETVKDGSYTISRPFNVVTKGEPSELAADFLSFVLSGEGKRVIEENGYIGVSDESAYAGYAHSGKLVIAGSSSVSPVMEKLIEAYKAHNPDAQIELETSDSSTGASSTAEGICDIGMISRALKDSEAEKGLTSSTIAMDGIAVIVNLENPCAALTREQVMDAYTGEYTSWAELVG